MLGGGLVCSFCFACGLFGRLSGFCASGRCQRFSLFNQLVDVAPGLAVPEVLNQGRNTGVDLVDQGEHVIGRFDGLVDDPIEQIFHRPRQFADAGGADQAATAFEGMESPANFSQSFAIVVILAQPRIELVDGLQNFFRFLNKNAEDFIIQQLGIRGFGLWCGGLFGAGLRFFSHGYFSRGLFGFFRQAPGGLLSDREAETGEAVFGHAQDSVVIADAICQSLQVILDTGNGIGQGVELFPVRNLFVAEQYVGDITLG